MVISSGVKPGNHAINILYETIMLTQREIYNLGTMIEEHGFETSDSKIFKLVVDVYKSGKTKARRSGIGYGIKLAKRNDSNKKHNV